jgi:hypothetical protein
MSTKNVSESCSRQSLTSGKVTMSLQTAIKSLNGSEVIITDAEIVDIIKSITKRPFVYERRHYCSVTYVQS